MSIALSDQPIQIPSQGYADEWIQIFKAAYPTMKDVARDIFVRLAGYPSWACMLEHANRNTDLIDFDALPAEERVAHAAAARRVLSDEFGLRPDVANHVAWTNPLGNLGFWPLRAPEFSVLRADRADRVSDDEHAALDQLNRSRCLDTREGQERLNAKPEIGAHLGLLEHLGWNVDILNSTPAQLAKFGSIDQFYAEPCALVVDRELGQVPLFVAGFTATPDAAHDQVQLHYLTAALNSAEILAGPGAPALILYERSVSCRHAGHYLTCFGAIAYDHSFKDLLLNARCTSISDVFVNLVATPMDSPAILDYADNQLLLQRMFERARQKHALPAGAAGTLARIEGASGWSEMTLFADTLT